MQYRRRRNSTRTFFKVEDLQLAERIVKMTIQARSRRLMQPRANSVPKHLSFRQELPPLAILYGTGFNSANSPKHRSSKDISGKDSMPLLTVRRLQMSVGVHAGGRLGGWSIDKQD